MRRIERKLKLELDPELAREALAFFAGAKLHYEHESPLIYSVALTMEELISKAFWE